MPTEKDGASVGTLASICDEVRTTLGPLGANKLVVQEDGTVQTTSSGSLVLEKLDLTNPTFTLLQSAASEFRSQEGDGTATLVTVLGELLAEADDLAEQGLHPTTIARGYRDALTIATEELQRRAYPVSAVGLEAVARTALTGTRDPAVQTDVAKYIAHAAETVGRETTTASDRQQIKVVSRIGGAQSQTELVGGVVLDAGPVTETMPRTLDGAGIAVLSATVDVPSLDVDSQGVQVGSFEDRVTIGNQEREAFHEQLDAAVEAGCDCIVTAGAVNDRVEQLLANRGILALDHVDEADLSRIARATGAHVVPGLTEFDETAQGAGDIRVRRTAGRDMTAIESDAGDPVFTVFCRAPDPRSVETFRRSVESAVAATLSAQQCGTVVPGGGAVETSVAHAVRESARSVDARSQLATQAFADALLAVPRTLATNAGMDGHTALARLHVAHADGRDVWGVDAAQAAVEDVTDGDAIVEPTALKQALLNTATDAAIELVRIDAQVAATDLNPDDGPNSNRAEKADSGR
ncbi:TCP-1/cpn60 chaperonin family protein [Halorussus sp. AFM4]|uniref:TCP-1/cpn60 chaperonin family protein n=1 Tax=Halorussus sp. AFM4 TaxID=3421651 RepID=UPI003EB87808